MKKLIVSLFLATGLLSFSRVVNSCEITSMGVYNNGERYVNCISDETGNHFNFRSVSYSIFSYLTKGYSYKIYFEGTGYKNLYITNIEY